MQVHFSSEHLARVTLLNCFNAIFKDRWLEITGSQNFLGFRKPGYMTTTSLIVAIVYN
jgi:hypothetical protein